MNLVVISSIEPLVLIVITRMQHLRLCAGVGLLAERRNPKIDPKSLCRDLP